MKFLPYFLKHLRRNWIRTTLHRARDGGLHLPVLHAADGARRRSDSRSTARSAERLVDAQPRQPGLPAAARLRGADRSRCPASSAWRRSNWFGGAAAEGASERSSDTDGATSSRTSRSSSRPYLAMYPEYGSPTRPEPRVPRRAARLRRRAAAGGQVRLEDRRQLPARERHPALPRRRAVRVRRPRDLRRRRRKYPGQQSLMLFHCELPVRGHAAAGGGRRLLRGDRRPETGRRGRAGDRRAVREQRRRDAAPRPSRPFPAGFVAMVGNLAFLLNASGSR